MMKRYLLIWIAMFCIGALLCSCYEDKGNYEYSNPVNIRVDSLKLPYAVYSLLDTLKTKPIVSPLEKEYMYWWGVYLKNAQGYTPVIDTICYTKDLDWLVGLSSGVYYIVFCVTDVETGVSKYIRKEIEVQTEFTNGTYLCKEIGGMTDYDLYTERGVAVNVMNNVHSSSFIGEPTGAFYNKRHWQRDPETGKYNTIPCLLTSTTEGVFVTKLADASLLQDFDDSFYTVPETRSASMLFMGGSEIFTCVGGLLYSQSTRVVSSGRFGSPRVNPHKLNQIHVVNTYCTPILFNELNNSLCFSRENSNELFYFNDAITKDLAQGLKSIIMIGNEVLIIPNKVVGEEFVTILRTDYHYTTKNPKIDQEIKGIDVSSDKKLFNMEVAVGVSKICYFSINNEIYSCEANNNFQESLQITLPVGYKVSDMHLVQDDSKYFVFISAYLGDAYFVYKYMEQAGRLIPVDDIYEEQKNPIYTGKGKVKKIIII